MAYRRLMGYPPYPNSGRAKKYGVPGIMGYQDLWVKGTSTVCASASLEGLRRAREVPGSAVFLEHADFEARLVRTRLLLA